MNKQTQLIKSVNGNSRTVVSNQEGIHSDLEVIVTRHLSRPYRKPVPEYAYKILDQIEKKLNQIGGKLILDSGCGTATSSIKLAEENIDDLIVGIDQSACRLNKKKIEKNNLLFFRANLIDIWLLMEKNNWKIDQHFLLYPNPWPKKKHLKRRWHGHPVFPSLIKISREIEIRSNWNTYLDEFAQAVAIMTGNKSKVEEFIPSEPLTSFEKKYRDSGQTLYRYRQNLS